MANAVLDVIETENLQQKAVEIGGLMMKHLNKLKEKYSVIGDVRGAGMFIGIELVINRQTKEPAALIADYVVSKFKENRILMSTEGKYENVLKFKPPMTFDESNVKEFISVLDDILQGVCDACKHKLDATNLIQLPDCHHSEAIYA